MTHNSTHKDVSDFNVSDFTDKTSVLRDDVLLEALLFPISSILDEILVECFSPILFDDIHLITCVSGSISGSTGVIFFLFHFFKE